MTTTDSPIAIDFGSGRIKTAYYDEETQDVEPMRLGSHGEFFLPAYIGVTANGNVVIGEHAERMVNKEHEARWVRDNVKRDLSQLKSLTSRLPRGKRSKPVEHILEGVFSELRTRVLQHQAFRGKEPAKVYATYTLLYPSTIKELFERVVQKVFAASEVVTVDEATAAAEMLRNTTAAAENLTDDLILLDCGAGTIDCCFLRWSGNHYGIYPLERMQAAYVSIPIGGSDIDEALVKLVQQKAGKAFNLRKSSVSVRQQVRLAKHEYCLYGDGAWSIQVNPETDVPLHPDEIQTAIRSEFIDKLCKNPEPETSNKKRSKPKGLSEHEVLTDYIEGIKGYKTPMLVLAGGCAKIDGLDAALHEAFDLQVTKISDLHRGAYATVLGPIYADRKKHKQSHARQNSASETRQTSRPKTDKPFADPIQALHFSPDNRYLVAAIGNCIQRWVITEENATPVPLERKRTLQHTDTISAVAFSEDSKRLAAATHTGDIRLWEAESNLPITDFKAKDSTITALAFSPDGTQFATGDREYKVKVWNINSGKAIETFVGKKGKYRHKGAVNSIAFSPEGHLLASGSQDGVVNIWRVETEQKPLTTHASGLRNVVSAAATLGVSTVLQEEHDCPVIHVSFFANIMDNTTIWTSLGIDGTLRFWRSYVSDRTERILTSIMGTGLIHQSSRKLDTLFDILHLLRIYARDTRGIHRLQGMQHRFIENGTLKAMNGLPYTDTLACSAFSPEIIWVALGSQEGRIHLWRSGEELITLL